MKKTIVFVLLLCTAFVVLCACNLPVQSGSGDPDGNSFAVIETPADHNSYTFHSYQDVVKALTQKESKEYSKLREEQSVYGAAYKDTLSKFAAEDIKIAVPQFGEGPMPLRNKDGYANISLLTSELYNLPWLWYRCVVNDQSLDVKISYLDAIENLDNVSPKTYTDVLKLIAPRAPSPENYEKYESYKTIYEKKVVLKDGVAVNAMISELKNSSKVYVMFYDDGLLVTLHGDNELFTDAFWQSFSISYH